MRYPQKRWAHELFVVTAVPAVYQLRDGYDLVIGETDYRRTTVLPSITCIARPPHMQDYPLIVTKGRYIAIAREAFIIYDDPKVSGKVDCEKGIRIYPEADMPYYIGKISPVCAIVQQKGMAYQLFRSLERGEGIPAFVSKDIRSTIERVGDDHPVFRISKELVTELLAPLHAASADEKALVKVPA
ncbi:MAG: hypothetical protein Q7S28_00070 [bacterium]|nr:hypothetical protein [bacterium]